MRLMFVPLIAFGSHGVECLAVGGEEAMIRDVSILCLICNDKRRSMILMYRNDWLDREQDL